MVERKKQMSRDKVSRLVNWGHWFAFINGLLAIIIGARYLETVGYPDSIVGWGYLALNTIGQFSFLAFIVYLVVLFPATLVIPYSKILRGLGAFVATAGLCTLLYDTIVYDDYGMHLSPFAFELAWADLNALLRGTSYIITPLAIIAIELTLANFLWKRIEKIQKRNWGYKVVAFVGVCFVSSHLIHIWADAADVSEITRYDDAYPLSYPATARSFMESHGVEGTSAPQENLPKNTIQYPKAPLQCKADQTQNVLVIGVNSLRADLVDASTMPFFHGYAQDNQSLTQHLSGGHQYQSGLFSLLYGIQGSYIDVVETHKIKPLMPQQFASQGYDVGLFTTATSPEKVAENPAFYDFEHHIASSEDGSAQADIQTVTEFKRWQAYRSNPWFAFVNLASPEDYDTPVGFLGIETVQADKSLKPAQKVLFNQYRQSLNFIDQQIESIVQQIPEDTLIIITGISGKVFTSNYRVASKNLSPANVHVPMVIHWPNGKRAAAKHTTSHLGLAPTLMSQVLGCTNPATDYSAGRDLLQPDDETWVYVGDKRTFAIYQKEEITVIDRHGKYRIYDRNYEKRLKKKMSAPELIQVMREGRRLFNN